jgi:hypothetical protein
LGRGREEPIQMKGQTLWYSIYESLLLGLKLLKMGKSYLRWAIVTRDGLKLQGMGLIDGKLPEIG